MDEHQLNQGFLLDSFEVYPELSQISSGGEEVRLEPKVMAVLVYLAQHAGNVVSRDELMTGVWGSVVVSDETITRSISALRSALGDSSQNSGYVQTIPKRGYRLLAHPETLPPTSAIAADAEKQGLQGHKNAERAATGRFSRRYLWMGVAFVAAIALLLIRWQLDVPDKVQLVEDPDRVSHSSIAVLSCDDLSPGQDQKYFAAGLADDLLTLLSRFPGLRVTGRSSSFAFQGTGASSQEIGAALNVQHLFQCSVRKSADRIRVTAQLVETASDTLIWSKTYDQDLVDVFKVQDDIAHQIMSTLKLHLFGQQPKSHVTDVETYERYLKLKYLSPFGAAGDDEALPFEVIAPRLEEEVLNRDPQFLPALSLAASMTWMTVGSRWYDRDEALIDHQRIVSRMEAVSPTDPMTLAQLAWTSALIDGEYERAAERMSSALEAGIDQLPILNLSASLARRFGQLELAMKLRERATELDPYCRLCWYALVQSYIGVGRYADAVRAADLCVQRWGMAHIIRGDAQFLQGNATAALESYASSPIPSHLRDSHRVLVLAELGRTDEATHLLSQIEERNGFHPVIMAANYSRLQGRQAGMQEVLSKVGEGSRTSRFLRFSSFRWDWRVKLLHDLPEWQALESELGLDDEAIARFRLTPPDEFQP